MAIQISCLRDGDFTKKCGSFRSFRWEWRNSISQLRSESIYNYFSDVKSAINENINGWMFIDILMYKRLPDYLIFKFPIMVSILTHNDDTKNIFPSSEQLPKCYPFQDLWQLFYFFYMNKTSLDGTQSSRRTGNRAHKTHVFKKNAIFATAKCTLRWAKFGQIFARKFGQICVSWGFLAKCVGHFFIFFQTRRFSVEIVFCWRRLCPLTYRHCQHLTYRRRSLLFEHNDPRDLFLNTTIPHPTPPHPISSVVTNNVATTPEISAA